MARPSSHGCHPPRRPPRAIRPPAPPPSPARERAACSVVNALGERIPEHDRQRDRRQQRSRPGRAARPRARTPRCEIDDEEHAPRARVIAPRGSSRIAVRGFSASWRASTSRLNPIAALRAATIATTIQSHAPADEPSAAYRSTGLVDRQQRAGQRERQRKDRMAEADERGVGAQAVQGSSVRGSGSRFEVRVRHRSPVHRFSQSDVRRRDRRSTRYSSTSSTPSGTRTAISAARFPGSMVP